MSQPFIRPYESRDFDACLNVFYVTIDPGLDFEPARTLGSYNWYRPYVSLTPSTCFVLDSGTGDAVGYIIGTSSTKDFVKKWREEFIPSVKLDDATLPTASPKTDQGEEGNTDLVPTPDAAKDEIVKFCRKGVFEPEGLLHEESPELLEMYPAHLHIDILPTHTGKGYGTNLVSTYLEKIKGLGATGVHLGMVAENIKARRFYERLGFRLFDEVMDGGVSEEKGRTGNAIWLVKSL
ncbi:GCN5-related N-acetyltransferas-like protein [Amniculicola lignicola CBS 123094]|uniref:GCN5-related N-acetyltransferas-like protein n=1 Tax=Amniculicola lignicola CBS 123094 TaxID=1392246 RepID=A0A6A5WYG6_9PLEO|nr:GCN5-related N-acetyltransferas-like protein [Amniculicola lignicola CBS 123094]